MRVHAALGALVSLFLLGAGAASASVTGAPVDGQMGLQDAATPVMENITEFHTLLLWIIGAISLFVLALLLWVMIRYNEKANPEPKKFSHNTLIEVVWTAVPVLILVVIAVPSFRLLYYQDVIPESDFTIKVTGNQWNWTYEYPDHGGFQYIANMVADEDIGEGQLRNLSTDLPVVVPADSTVRVEVTASDVIHNWAMPAFGIKMDAIPGRLNETWFEVGDEDVGVYYGQCSELCGLRHAFMPIEVHVVPQPVFDEWVEAANEDPYEAPQVLAAYYDEQRGAAALASAR
ncbi:cytochrome c oxidase subunit II [Marinicauda salina]|jgi:cytochrome c oxidase subunit 2|uniref:Cytochrome c oxidase subunit 2 n=1 Tax=Marinicauda salina TaxID=2135793 RepID=A0A2U2BUI5_9PROT|nr:cytochrome c oxidase subunit II [Marinicauda salina]PWE17662.1 cytochrome c oxidase subunit II [Marinicauda salina]